MDNFPVTMIRPHLRDIPDATLPPGLRIRPLAGPNESALWTDIVRDSEPYLTVGDDLFAKQFGDDLPATARRLFIVETREADADSPEAAVATIGAWKEREGAFPERDGWGRIHWVAVRPSAQNAGIGKAMVSHALGTLAGMGHDKAFLDTSTARLAAIKIYLDFGFVPHCREAENGTSARAAWQIVADTLRHPSLAGGIRFSSPD